MRHDCSHLMNRVHKPCFESIQDTYTHRPQPEENSRDWQWLWAVLFVLVLVGSTFLGA